MAATASGNVSPADGAATIDWPAELARHDRWLRAVVLARTGEAQAVDEVMQEVALAAVRQRAILNDASKAAPWLYRLAVRQSLLFRRKIGRRRKLTERYANQVRPGQDEERENDPLGWLLADERRRLIRVALGRLRRQDAEMLLLKYIDNWSYHEIAAHLGASHSAVEARLHRARAALRNELAAMQVIEAAT
jgi:RNA polymerase sigma factor (sigma-70 family)